MARCLRGRVQHSAPPNSKTHACERAQSNTALELTQCSLGDVLPFGSEHTVAQCRTFFARNRCLTHLPAGSRIGEAPSMSRSRTCISRGPQRSSCGACDREMRCARMHPQATNGHHFCAITSHSDSEAFSVDELRGRQSSTEGERPCRSHGLRYRLFKIQLGESCASSCETGASASMS